MKKLLALVLALVMSMSLVTISNADFNDADEIDYAEAVEVMNAVGVLKGYDNGDFGPTDTLTRAQACKIIAYLDLGGKAADAIKGSGAVFSDVPATAWYAGYVEYCAGAGYVSGVGGGKFDPDAKVTGVQFAKMLLCALGYKADVEGYNGADWSLSIARDANKIDLFDGLSIVISAVLTREQAAQMALNALQATVVEYEGGTNVSTSDGTKVTVNATRKEVESSTDKDYNTVEAKKDSKQQLCEKLYGKDLTKTTGSSDALGRPATMWTYDTKKVGTYADKPDYTFTGVTSENTVYKTLGGENGTLSIAYANIYEDGANLKDDIGETGNVTYSKSVTNNAPYFGNGIKVEAYDMGTVDGKIVWRLVAIRDYIGQVTTVNKANADKDEDRSIVVTLDMKPTGFATKHTSLKYETEQFAKKDWVIVNVAKVGSDIEIQSIQAATKLGDKAVTSYKDGGANKATVTFGGEKYSFSQTFTQNGGNLGLSYKMESGNSYDFYLDSYGNVIKSEAYKATNTDYVQVINFTAADSDKKSIQSTSIDDDYYWEVKYVAMDGTTKTEKVYSETAAESDLVLGKIYTVEADDDHDGYVIFTEVQTADKTKDYYETDTITTKFDKNKAVYGKLIFDNDTVFVVKKPDATKYSVINGLSAMDSYNLTTSVNAYSVMDDTAAVVVFMDLKTGATASTSSDTLVYIYDKTYDVGYDQDNKCTIHTYKTTDGTIDVKPTENKTFNDTYTAAQDSGLFMIKGTSDGYASKLTLVTTTEDGKYTALDVTDKEVKFSGNVLSVESNGAYVLADDVTVITIDSDNNVETVEADALVGTATGKFFLVAKSGDDATVKTVYFQGEVK